MLSVNVELTRAIVLRQETTLEIGGGVEPPAELGMHGFEPSGGLGMGVMGGETEMGPLGPKGNAGEARRLFEEMHEAEGMRNMLFWFTRRARLSQRNAEMVHAFGEDEFVAFGREFAMLPDYDLLDWYDFLDAEARGELYFEQFFLFIAFMLAGYAHILSAFWYRHASTMWKLQGLQPLSTCPAEMATRLAYFLRIREKVILVEVSRLVPDPTKVSFDDFNALYFSIFSQYDEGFSLFKSILQETSPFASPTGVPPATIVDNPRGCCSSCCSIS